MTSSTTTTLTSDGSEYPWGIILCFVNVMDTWWGESSEWRNHVPFGWSDPGRALSWKAPARVTDSFPPLLTFQDFLSSTTSSETTTIPITTMMQQIYKYAFETPSTELGNVLSPTSLLVLVCLVFTLRQVKSKVCLPIFSQWGRQAGRHTHGHQWELQNEERIIKFGEYVFRLLYHSIISMIGILYFWNSEWWNLRNSSGRTTPPTTSTTSTPYDEAGIGTTSLWNNYPHDPILPGMAWYYLCQCAYNVDALVSLLELSFVIQWGGSSSSSGDGSSKNTSSSSSKSNPPTILHVPYLLTLSWSSTCRGDFTEMFIHHIVTNLLVMGSSFFRLTRVGSMVFLVHDVSDVPVDLSKLANFLKWKVTTIVCFITMVLVWAVTRLGIFPFVIYKSVLVESYLITQSVPPIHYYSFFWFFALLIAMIILLHVAWFGMFIQMGYLLVTKNETHDLSEHKQGEPDAFGTPPSTTTTITNGTTNGTKKHN